MSRGSTAPKHRARRTAALTRAVKRQAVVTGVALATTGVAVSIGVAASGERPAPSGAAAALVSELGSVDAEVTLTAELAELESRRDQRVSRSDRRTDVDRTKARLLAQETETGGQVTRTEDLASQDPKLIAQSMLPEFGFSSSEFACLDSLWTKESGWNPTADNPTSSAYGIPQSLPGSKMASAGADWATNPATQIRWGLGYIADAYGTPCVAWSHSQANNWY